MNEIGNAFNFQIADKLHNLLAHNIVSFTFRKVNGELRHAKGTRNLDLARAHTGAYIPNPVYGEQPNSYYDVECNGWRSYKPENLISIDGVVARTDTDFAKNPTTPNEPKKGELPKREIPISKPMDGGADIDKFGIGGLFGGMFGGSGIPMGEIRKAMDDLDKDIEIVPIGGKVGVPTATEKGIELPLGDVSVDAFAKLVAHYVVEEFVNRLK